ncbi:fatty acid-binding protein, muscle-like isoform X2 [Choristoneura fumiferana]|uniref:fatty acid-binding protein, muscle-like isoform X2 n=1 Tax=Choristoneura fumiferana TaxID=7141 RepID=UPI003D157BE7
MEEFLGKKYALTTSENFEEYLVFIGKGYLHRKAARSLRQEHWLTKNDDGTYTFSFSSPLTSSEMTFTPGEEFEETKPDGVKVKSLITIDGNKMTHIQTEENGRISKHVREFYPDQMIVVCHLLLLQFLAATTL